MTIVPAAAVGRIHRSLLPTCGANHLPHGAAGRRVRVNGFVEGTEFHLTPLQVVEHGD
jgi:hypothetical protein